MLPLIAHRSYDMIPPLEACENSHFNGINPIGTYSKSMSLHPYLLGQPTNF